MMTKIKFHFLSLLQEQIKELLMEVIQEIQEVKTQDLVILEDHIKRAKIVLLLAINNTIAL